MNVAMSCAPSPSQIDALLDCLDAEIAEISDFIDLLEKEAAILIDSVSLNEIPALTETKEASARRFASLADQREQLLHALGGPGDRPHMDDVAATDDELWQAWQTLLDIAEQARSLNLRNGALIDIHLHHTQQSLEALRTAAGINDVYTADGKPQTLSRSAPISVG